MKRLLLTTALLALLLASSVLAGPRISVPESSFDWGKVPQSVKVSHTFWLYSTGDDTLRITKVVPGCGCTQAPLQDSVLAPGDSTRIDIFFDTQRYGGYVTKKPYIETNIDDLRTMLTIDSHVLNFPDSAYPIILSPNKLDVSQFTETPRRKATFTIQNVGSRDYTLTLVDHPPDFFTVKLPGVIKAGESAQAEIEVVKEKIGEEFERSLTFQIDDGTNMRYTLPIKRMVRIKQASTR